MGLFKKLQENSLYWRYRFITRRWLASKRWWREHGIGRPRSNVVRVRYRGMAAASPYVRSSGSDTRRGVAFVLALAVIWSALSLSSLPQDGLLIGVARIATLAALVYAFVRFW